MIIEHRTRDNHQNADQLRKKTELYERQELKEADSSEKKDRFSFIDKVIYDNFSLTRWLDKSVKPIGDHPELPTEHRETIILGRQPGIPVELLLKSMIVRETLKAKDYDQGEVKNGRLAVRQALMRLLQKLADNKPVDMNEKTNEPELTIMRRSKEVPREKS